MIERFCPDRFITSARIRMTAMLMLAATIIGLLAIVLTAHGTVDALGRPVGTDFSNVYSAGWMADHGRAPDAWDWPAEHAMQKVIHKDPNTPLYGWHYPPPFLIIATLLAQFPYLTALFIWQGLSLALALLVFHRILPGREAMLAAVGAPVVMVCLGHGQNAFMTASLMAGGMLLLDRRPWVAGILLGCLVYKPQFAVLIPIVIAMKGNWRAFLAAGLTVVALCLLTWAIWGWGVWAAPGITIVYLWMESNWSIAECKRAMDKTFFCVKIPTVILSNWLVWIPAVSVVYAMPTELQIPLFNLVLCFWVLLLAVLNKKIANP